VIFSGVKGIIERKTIGPVAKIEVLLKIEE
jgi:hypothetical protein